MGDRRGFTGKLADPQVRHERAMRGGQSRTGVDYHLRKIVAAAPDGGIDDWATSVAASLPPLTPDEAAAVGRLAVALDARCRAGAA
jgi:hypothetical protein